MKYQVGDRVRVVSNQAGHDFEVGEVLNVDRVDESDTWLPYRLRNELYPDLVPGPWVRESDIEPVEPIEGGGSAHELAAVCDEIKEILLAKNKAYGDSALDPVRLFSKADTVEQINVRLDDKLSRIARGHEYPGDDTVTDIIGYLVLLLVAKRRESRVSEVV
jgi:hypothetical protein